MEWEGRYEQERHDRKKKKTKTKRETGKRKLLAQNFYMVVIPLILREPPAYPWGK